MKKSQHVRLQNQDRHTAILLSCFLYCFLPIDRNPAELKQMVCTIKLIFWEPPGRSCCHPLSHTQAAWSKLPCLSVPPSPLPPPGICTIFQQHHALKTKTKGSQIVNTVGWGKDLHSTRARRTGAHPGMVLRPAEVGQGDWVCVWQFQGPCFMEGAQSLLVGQAGAASEGKALAVGWMHCTLVMSCQDSFISLFYLKNIHFLRIILKLVYKLFLYEWF